MTSYTLAYQNKNVCVSSGEYKSERSGCCIVGVDGKMLFASRSGYFVEDGAIYISMYCSCNVLLTLTKLSICSLTCAPSSQSTRNKGCPKSNIPELPSTPVVEVGASSSLSQISMLNSTFFRFVVFLATTSAHSAFLAFFLFWVFLGFLLALGFFSTTKLSSSPALLPNVEEY